MKKYFLFLFLLIGYSHSQAYILDDSTLEILAIELPVTEFPAIEMAVSDLPSETAEASVELVWSPILTDQILPEPLTLKDQRQTSIQEPPDSWQEEERQMEKFCVQAAQNPGLYEISLVEVWQQ
ncbi:MAG: hypothetical protein JNM39_02820 [Bdellovibrionaceae bacterium]|nr:hypothetical protein [Pseudobdellovibrionaceae bacterium]